MSFHGMLTATAIASAASLASAETITIGFEGLALGRYDALSVSGVEFDVVERDTLEDAGPFFGSVAIESPSPGDTEAIDGQSLDAILTSTGPDELFTLVVDLPAQAEQVRFDFAGFFEAFVMEPLPVTLGEVQLLNDDEVVAVEPLVGSEMRNPLDAYAGSFSYTGTGFDRLLVTAGTGFVTSVNFDNFVFETRETVIPTPAAAASGAVLLAVASLRRRRRWAI